MKLHELILSANVRIYYFGLVLFTIQAVQETTCPIKIQHFPFDEQTCTLELLFKSHTTSEVTI